LSDERQSFIVEETKVAINSEQDENVNSQIDVTDENMDDFDALDGDLEDLGIDFLLEEVENKIAPLALA
jgi:hypothetical protein